MSNHRADAGTPAACAAFAIGGLLALRGLFFTQRKRTIGRVAVIVAGLLQFNFLLAYHRLVLVPIVAATVIGIVLIVCGFSAGPVPPRRGASSI